MVGEWRRYVERNNVLEIDGLAARKGYSNGGRYYEDLAVEVQQKPRAPRP